MKQDTYQKGIVAELIAILSLLVRGYRIVSWRYKTKFGEIDVIARRGRTLAFIEVKRRASLDEALLCLTPAMRRRIGQAARHYMSRHAGDIPETLRFDLIAVSGLSVLHLDNAWQDGSY